MTDARPELPEYRGAAGALLDARLHLLDRQLVDRDGETVATVDDVEIDDVEAGSSPHVAALLSGAALWTRTFGGQARRSRLAEVPWHDVTDVGVIITVARAADDYDASWSERWMREHLIARIPGGRHAPE